MKRTDQAGLRERVAFGSRYDEIFQGCLIVLAAAYYVKDLEGSSRSGKGIESVFATLASTLWSTSYVCR